jgi:hypothetical protein
MAENLDHEGQAHGRLPQEFKNSTTLKDLISALVAEVQELETVSEDLRLGRTIDDAEGVQLDLLGVLLGQERGGSSDADYKLKLKVKVRINLGSGTPEDLLSILVAQNPGIGFTLREFYPASFTIEADGVPDQPTLTGETVQSAKAGGVNGQLIAPLTDADHSFTFSDDSSVEVNVDQGFGDSQFLELGVTWGLTRSGAGTSRAIAFGNGTFVGSHGSDHVITSSDGKTWGSPIAIAAISGQTIRGIAYGAGVWIVVADDGFTTTICSSTNLSVWNSRLVITGVSYTATYLGGVFLVGGDGIIAYSTSGTSWGWVAGLGSDSYRSFAYDGSGVWIVVGTNGKIRRSTNHTSWSAPSSLPVTGGSFYGVAFGNSTWVAVGNSGLLFSGSTDGQTWTSRTSGASGDLDGVNYDATRALFFAWGIDTGVDGICTSSNGTSWTLRDSQIGGGTGVQAMLITPTIIAVGGSAGSISYSEDGLSWTSTTSPFGASSINAGVLSTDLSTMVFCGGSGKFGTSAEAGGGLLASSY